MDAHTRDKHVKAQAHRNRLHAWASNRTRYAFPWLTGQLQQNMRQAPLAHPSSMQYACTLSTLTTKPSAIHRMHHGAWHARAPQWHLRKTSNSAETVTYHVPPE